MKIVVIFNLNQNKNFNKNFNKNNNKIINNKYHQIIKAIIYLRIIFKINHHNGINILNQEIKIEGIIQDIHNKTNNLFMKINGINLDTLNNSIK